MENMHELVKFMPKPRNTSTVPLIIAPIWNSTCRAETTYTDFTCEPLMADFIFFMAENAAGNIHTHPHPPPWSGHAIQLLVIIAHYHALPVTPGPRLPELCRSPFGHSTRVTTKFAARWRKGVRA